MTDGALFTAESADMTDDALFTAESADIAVEGRRIRGESFRRGTGLTG